MTERYRVTIASQTEAGDADPTLTTIWFRLLSDVDSDALIQAINEACYSPAVKAKRKRTRKAVKA